MKNLRNLVGLILVLAVTAGNAFAYNVGYSNFKKIEANYNYAKEVYKDIDNKTLEIQQFIINKDKEYKTIESPIAKKNFEEKTQKDYQAKADSLYKLKAQKEDEIFNNIMAATKAVANKKELDMVLDYRVIFVGGVDISDDVIKYLNSTPVKKK